jgi:chromosome segregation ATPase
MERENDLQEPWAESHRLLNELRKLQKSKDDTITALQSAISTKDAELADAAESIEELEAKLSEAQAHAYVKLSELDHVKSIRCTNDQLTTENAVLISRVERLKRDIVTRDAILTRSTARIERLTTKNMELEESLQNSLNEIEKGRKSLEDWLNKHNCVICTSAEADRLTECGHLFCKECLVRWEEDWYRESDPYGDMQGKLKGILTCPTCKDWVVMSKLKQIYHS